jgi:hypothetical protein
LSQSAVKAMAPQAHAPEWTPPFAMTAA